MRALFIVASTVLLCSCAGMSSSIQSSVNGMSYQAGPTSADDPRLRSARFYMDGDDSPSVRSVSPLPFQSGQVDNFCTMNCLQHYSGRYCNQACSR
jgi:hypothetical protein